MTLAGGVPTWAAGGGGGVTTFSAGTTGLTPSTATSGAVTLAGTLAIANGGTGQTTQTTGFNALSPTTTKGDLIVSNGTDNVRQAVGTDTFVLTADSTTATGVKWGSIPFATPSLPGTTYGDYGAFGTFGLGQGITVSNGGLAVGYLSTSNNAVAVGLGAIASNNGIAIGQDTVTANGSISIGYKSSAFAGSIVLSNTYNFASATAGVFIDNMRASSSGSPSSGLQYNSTTKEITYGNATLPSLLRVLASTANVAQPTLNTDSYDMMVITGQSVAITSFTANLTGTPVNGQRLWIAITGTAAIAITWGSSFESSTSTLPNTTVTTNRLDIGFVWNAATSKWRCVSQA